jgi:hypothetical protein
VLPREFVERVGDLLPFRMGTLTAESRERHGRVWCDCEGLENDSQPEHSLGQVNRAIGDLLPYRNTPTIENVWGSITGLGLRSPSGLTNRRLTPAASSGWRLPGISGLREDSDSGSHNPCGPAFPPANESLETLGGTTLRA